MPDLKPERDRGVRRIQLCAPSMDAVQMGFKSPVRPIGCSRGAEKECCSILRDCQEPPDAEPHVRWCGGRKINRTGYPIRHSTDRKAW